MPDAHANFAYTLVAVVPSPAISGSALSVTAGTGTRFPATPFNATVWPAGELPLPDNAEIVRVTGISGDVLTITRAQEGASARVIMVGDQIAATITKKTITDIENDGVILAPGAPDRNVVQGTDGSTAFIVRAAPGQTEAVIAFENEAGEVAFLFNQDDSFQFGANAPATFIADLVGPLCALAEIGSSSPVLFGATNTFPLSTVSPGNFPCGMAVTPLHTLAAGGYFNPLLWCPTFSNGTLTFGTSTGFMEFCVYNPYGTEKLMLHWPRDVDIDLTSGETYQPDMSGWVVLEHIGTDLSVDFDINGVSIIRSAAGGQFTASWIVTIDAEGLTP